jgi:predicted glycogen debranching enzyme
MREWLVTNGLGGYASLTYTNFNTRKFHGLLVASLNPPTERWVFVSNVYDKVKVKDRVYDLKNLNSEFTFDLFPSFTYHIEKTKIKKTILMEHGKNTTLIKYDISGDFPISITHSIIANSRHFYDVTRQRYLSFTQYFSDNCVRVTPSNINKTLKIILDDANYEQTNYWLELFYQKDHERQDSWVDNNVHIGDFHKYITTPVTYYLTFSIEDQSNIDPPSIYARETKRKQSIIEQSCLPNKFDKLVLSSDNFVVKKGNSKSLIAGYHWFSDWGRDALISLPGLTLVTKRFDDAKNILLTLSGYVKNGLVPNFFAEPDARPVYNTVDASLWFIDRVYQYLKYTDDQNFIENIWTTLVSIIDSYKKGTDYGIHMDHDFLISHNPGMTWMDVKIGDYYSTPRAHKAVEIQSLWYNALQIMSVFAKQLGKDDIYTDVSLQVKDNFLNQYDQQYDVIDKRDTSFRPNQIFLVSLDHSMINNKIQEKIVKDVEERLLTVFGLRTLSPDDSRYMGKYLGDFNRDLAYHNGTVWPWLIGPFVKSFVKVHDYQKNWRDYAYQNFLKTMLDVFGKNWDGSINEIFDGDAPYVPRGCISQAWSVAEILRTWVEDIEAISPKYEDVLLTT